MNNGHSTTKINEQNDKNIQRKNNAVSFNDELIELFKLYRVCMLNRVVHATLRPNEGGYTLFQGLIIS